MNCLKPIDENLDFTLKTDIKTLLSEIKTLRSRGRTEIKKSLYSFKKADVMTAKKKENDILTVYTDTTKDIMTKTYELVGKIISMGETVDLDKVSRTDKRSLGFSEGFLRCYAMIARIYQEFRGEL